MPLSQPDNVHSDVPRLWGEDDPEHVARSRTHGDDRTGKCHTIGNTLKDVVDRLIFRLLPLKMAVDITASSLTSLPEALKQTLSSLTSRVCV